MAGGNGALHMVAAPRRDGTNMDKASGTRSTDGSLASSSILGSKPVWRAARVSPVGDRFTQVSREIMTWVSQLASRKQ